MMATSKPSNGTSAPDLLSGCRCLVVKIGSALLLDTEGQLDPGRLGALADDLATFVGAGVRLVLVTSGAVAAGRSRIGLPGRRLTLAQKQAAAAVGQVPLFNAWGQAFQPHGHDIAQVLLTTQDTEDRRRHLNARATLSVLIDRGVIPIINENDTIATDEIRFGDNDRLAARVAQLISADLLVLLSDIDGLYTADPRRDVDARHLPLIDKIDEKVRAMAGGAGTVGSSGGMVTKLAAAEIATRAGCTMIIANGHVAAPLRALADGARCTIFRAALRPTAARKAWLASTVNHAGSLRLDSGAVRAICRGSSLLPVGVTAQEGNFDKGDTVQLLTPEGVVIGHGLVNYTAQEAAQLIGRQRAPEHEGPHELIHRDNLVHFKVQEIDDE